MFNHLLLVRPTMFISLAVIERSMHTTRPRGDRPLFSWRNFRAIQVVHVGGPSDPFRLMRKFLLHTERFLGRLPSIACMRKGPRVQQRSSVILESNRKQSVTDGPWPPGDKSRSGKGANGARARVQYRRLALKFGIGPKTHFNCAQFFF